MDTILSKHLASAFLLPKKENSDLSGVDENFIPYHSFKLIDGKYYIKLEEDTVVSENKGYWNDKPVIEYNTNKYVLLENSQRLVNLNNLSNSENKIISFKSVESPKVISKAPRKNEETKKDVKLISIPMNSINNTASYIPPKAPNEDAEEKKVANDSSNGFIESLDKIKDDPRVKKFFNYHSELAKKEMFSIVEKFSQQQMARAMESGGGTNAAQFANGGKMNGSLIVEGDLTVTGSVNGGGMSKRVFTVGNNVDSEYILVHSLGTKDIVVSLYDNNDEAVYATVKNISINETKLVFNSVINTNSIKAVILG